jgi:hypothetical protein
MNPELGREYVNTILAPGGSRDFMQLVKTFLGKESDPQALAEAIKSDIPEIKTLSKKTLASTKNQTYHASNSSAKSNIKQPPVFTHIDSPPLPVSLSASKFLMPIVLGLIPVGLSLIPSAALPFALSIGLVSGLVTGAVIFAATLGASLIREKIKNNALDYYTEQSKQKTPAVSQVEIDVLKLGIASAQSLTTQALSCFQWQAYRAAYYAGMKAQESGKDEELRQKFQI